MEEKKFINFESNRTNNNDSTENLYIINRPAFSQYEFELKNDFRTKKLSLSNQLLESINKIKKKKFSQEKCCQFIYGKFPFLSIILNYKWKDWFLEDFITGLIVGIMHIPQGMAYAQLAGLRPVYGLYVSLFPALVYFCLGTSRQISIGSMAIASLMTNKFLEKSLIDFPLQPTQNITVDYETANNEIENLISSRAAGFAFFVGLTQLLMGCFNMGSLTRYLTDSVIAGFTVGSSVHVFASQIKFCFGIEIQQFYGVFNVIYTIIEVFMKLPETNVPTISITLICIVLLVVTKEIINPYVMAKIRCPCPMELFVVITGIIVSEHFRLNENHSVRIVGEISKGLPSPKIPDIKISYNYVSDIIITAVICFTVSVSLGKIFSKKHGYKIFPNQEFLAYGTMNIFSSFFSCFPSSASLSRSAVQESVGGKTQLSSIFSSILLTFALLFIGQLFEKLPNCILAAVIIVALKGIFMQFGELKYLWSCSLIDFNIWMITFLGTALVDVEYGLFIGVTLSLFSAVLRTQNPKSILLGYINGTDIYSDLSYYTECKEIPGIKIFRFEGSLYFACCENFKKNLFEKTGVDPTELVMKIKNLNDKISNLEKRNAAKENRDLLDKALVLKDELDNLINSNRFYIIIDCSNWGFIDIMGMKTLDQTIEEYRKIGIPVKLVSPKSDIQKAFKKFKSCNIDEKMIFMSIHDAVVTCLFYQSSGKEHEI